MSAIRRPDVQLHLDTQDARRLGMALEQYRSRGATLARLSMPAKMSLEEAGELYRQFVKDGHLPLAAKYQRAFDKLNVGEQANFREMWERTVYRLWPLAPSA